MQSKNEYNFGEYSPERLQQIAAAVTEARARMGWSQSTLAAVAGVPVAAIKCAELGGQLFPRDCVRHYLRRIAEALGLLPNCFTDEEPNEPERMWVEARDLDSPDGYDAVLNAQVYDLYWHLMLDTDLCDEITAFQEVFVPLRFYYEESAQAERIIARRSMAQAIERIHALGFRIKYAAYETEDAYRAAVLVFGRYGDKSFPGVKKLVVPRYREALLPEPKTADETEE